MRSRPATRPQRLLLPQRVLKRDKGASVEEELLKIAEQLPLPPVEDEADADGV